MAVAVCDHALKFWAIVGMEAGQAAICVYLDHSHVVLFGEALTGANLSFDGFFALVVAGEAGIYDGFQIGSPP